MLKPQKEDIEVSYIHHAGSDLTVVNAARVSFNKQSAFEYYDGDSTDLYTRRKAFEAQGWTVGAHESGVYEGEVYAYRLKNTDKKLIRYLARSQHTSPFNHCFLTYKIRAPIFVIRQLVKHAYMPINEVSRRYVDTPPTFYPMKWRWRSDSAKQGSSGEVDENSQAIFDKYFWDSVDHALEVYEFLIQNKVAPEQARAVLPLNTNTEWYWSGTLGAFAKMINLRDSLDTQKETREVATLLKEDAMRYFPVSLDALLKLSPKMLTKEESQAIYKD